MFAAHEAPRDLPILPADFAPRSLGTRVMLNLLGPVAREPFCDRLSRRNFLRIGSLGAAGLTLAQLFRAEAQAGIAKSRKSLILIYLVGGPPQLDMFDLKPNAPREVAGPFRPIKTNVPGIEICEHMPQLAQRMDRLAIVRSIADSQADHDAFQCFTGAICARAGPAAHGPPSARRSPDCKARPRPAFLPT